MTTGHREAAADAGAQGVPGPLVGVHWLASRVTRPGTVVLDASVGAHRETGRRIPGARRFGIDGAVPAATISASTATGRSTCAFVAPVRRSTAGSRSRSEAAMTRVFTRVIPVHSRVVPRRSSRPARVLPPVRGWCAATCASRVMTGVPVSRPAGGSGRCRP